LGRGRALRDGVGAGRRRARDGRRWWRTLRSHAGPVAAEPLPERPPRRSARPAARNRPMGPAQTDLGAAAGEECIQRRVIGVA
jgi:hypothetical protein